jgi:hypothetical protein
MDKWGRNYDNLGNEAKEVRIQQNKTLSGKEKVDDEQTIRKAQKENNSVAGEGEDTSAQFLQRFRVAQIWQIITTKCGEGIPRGRTFRDQVALVWGKELLNLWT